MKWLKVVAAVFFLLVVIMIVKDVGTDFDLLDLFKDMRGGVDSLIYKLAEHIKPVLSLAVK